MLGKTGLHAIKALAALAQSQDGGYVGAAAIAVRIRSPRNYLGKLLQSLAREGLVQGQKGLNGGFRLARRPELISLYDVVDPIEHLSRWNACFLTQGACRCDRPCRVHGRWAGVRDSYVRFLKETTLQDVAEGSEEGSRNRVLPVDPVRRRRVPRRTPRP